MSTHASPGGWRRVGDVAGFVLPSALSTMRVVCAAIFPFALPHTRLALIIIAAISDGLDGLIARRLGRTTWWGGFLDAGADKIFVATVMIDLLVRGQLAWWQVVLLLTRDLAVVFMLVVAMLMRRWDRIKAVSAGPVGKLTTAVLFVLFAALVGWPEQQALIWPLMIAAMALSILAAIDYAVRVARICLGAP